MEKELEQSEVDIITDNQDVDPKESIQDSKVLGILGKFTSVETLAKAYEELQIAFTRKSQELAELKTNASVANHKEVVENVQAPAAIQTDKSAEEIIKTYLLSVATGKVTPKVIAGSGNGLAFSNITETKSIHATTKVAENFFKEKKF